VSAVAVSSDQLYCGDTSGYVVVYTLQLAPKFFIDSPRSRRCHPSEITKIEPIENGRYFATVGVDLAVRLWDLESLGCVGTFGDSHGWNIEDPNTWRHFELEEEEQPPHPSSSRTSGLSTVFPKLLVQKSSFLNMSLLKAGKASLQTQSQGPTQAAAKPPQPKNEDFDWIGAYERMQAAMNAPPAPMPSLSEIEAKKETTTKKKELPSLLQHSLDAKELLTRIAILRDKKVPTMESVLWTGRSLH
jgi:hypothetical protein